MNKKTAWGSFLGALAVAAAAIVAAKQPHHSTPAPPPVPTVPTYTLVVHVCADACSFDHKLPNASVTYADSQPVFVTDGAGNVAIPHVTAGKYHVCAKIDGYVQACADHAVPADGEAFLGLVRDVPPVQALHADGHIFRTADGQPWRYKGVTAFQLLDLYRQGQDVLPFVRLYHGLGFNTFRVLVNKSPSPPYPGWTTPPLETALAFVSLMAKEGVYVELTLFGSRVDSSFVPSWIEALRHLPNVLVEGINEPGHDGQYPDTSSIDALILPRRGNLPYASGAYDISVPLRGSYGTIHTDRASDPYDTARKAKAVQEMFDYARIPWVGDEPGKPQDLGYHADAFLSMFAIYGLFGGGGTFHSLGSQFGQLPSADELACAKAAIQGLDAFPADAPNTGGYVHDTADEAATGSLRTYRSGPYGVRVHPTNGAPILIGAR